MADENVKVAVRVRPFNSREKDRNAKLIIKMVGNSTYISDPANVSSEPRKFAFDYSYWSHNGYKEEDNGYLSPTEPAYADQNVVFKDLGEGVLSNAWKGYNCSLFAYGQTGSGKSYSMVGYGVNKGIIPITCDQLFQGIETKQKAGSTVEYQVSLSMLEIYNEQVRDLLNPSTLKMKGGMKVRQNPKSGFYVDGLLLLPVGSYKEIDAKIEQGTKNRTVASTNMNATSSRAHTIVALTFMQKGKNETTGQNTTKTSIINLVDLAGSERADSTGATGDRLKEGSAINKSLSTLGNVIKALADSSSGKKTLVPFRDSVLTKLLKNALGGNSKTIMIAALSPADINYEETLSTLRFADRAKAIKTKAVINESPTDKLIRELREENARLVEQLKQAQGDPVKLAAIAAEQNGDDEPEDTGVKFDEKEVERMKEEMEERMRRNQEEMEQMKKSWEERLKEEQNASKAKEDLMRKEHEMKKLTAHFWNLNEDPQLTNMIFFFLQPGKYRIGNKKAEPSPDILLNGLSIQKEHATVTHSEEMNCIKLFPAIGAKVLVNGVSLVDECELHHGDRVLFGNNHLFVLHHPKDQELLRRREEAQKIGKDFEENEVSFEKAQEEIAKNSGLLDFNDITNHKGGNKSAANMMLQDDLLKILPMINEANAMSEELDKKVAFEPVLISPQTRGESEGKTQVNVKMRDLINDNEWLWNKDKFVNRKFIMQEMYQNFVDGQTDWDLPNDKDPFWEPYDTDVLIGSVLVYLQSLAYLIEVEESIAITDYKGNEQGQLKVKLEPCTKEGENLAEDDFVDKPEELVGASLHFRVSIIGALGLPRKFSKGESFCKYKIYLDERESITDTISNTINPIYNHEKMFSFDPVTKLLVDYLTAEPLVIYVWGKQSLETINSKKKQIFSTKQLMNQDQLTRRRTNTQMKEENDDRYKMMCEINTQKRRAQRNARKLKRIDDLITLYKKNQKNEITISELDSILHGPDKKDMQRFHAAAGIVLKGEKFKHELASKHGKVQRSTACEIQ